MRVLICGDRNWTDRKAISDCLLRLRGRGFTTLIHGAARGADSIAAEEAQSLGFEVLPFPAEWERYGRAAGPRRNQQMLEEGRPQLVLYFHDNLEASKGTRDMVTRAQKMKLFVFDGCLLGEEVAR